MAQKPEEKKEIIIIVKADDESAEPTEAVATIDDGEFTITTDVVATAEDDGKPTEVRVEVKTDDSTDKVVAESLDQAIKKIKEQIEVIKKETKPGEQQKIRVRALENVVRQLENSARQTKTLKPIAGKKEEVRRAIVNRVGKIEEIRTAKEEVRRAIVQTPEMRAEINKARAKVKELSDALRTKQKELAEAQAKLSQLQSSAHAAIGLVKINPQTDKQVVRLRELTGKPVPPPPLLNGDTPSIAMLTLTRNGSRIWKRSSTNFSTSSPP